jgi:hypothetical protein
MSCVDYGVSDPSTTGGAWMSVADISIETFCEMKVPKNYVWETAIMFGY